MKRYLILITGVLALITTGCGVNENKVVTNNKNELPGKFLVVLGIAQDAGYPQIGCSKECCKAYWEGKEEKKKKILFLKSLLALGQSGVKGKFRAFRRIH